VKFSEKDMFFLGYDVPIVPNVGMVYAIFFPYFFPRGKRYREMTSLSTHRYVSFIECVKEQTNHLLWLAGRSI